jgi:hypothetical protein
MFILKQDESTASGAGNACSVNMWFKDVLQNKTSIFRALESKCGSQFPFLSSEEFISFLP